MPHYIRETLRIMIVEDDRVAARFLEEYLKGVGVCELVSTAEDALSRYEESLDDEPYGLICLDIGLPDLSGKDVLVKLRQLEKDYELEKDEAAVIIMTTAQCDLKDVLQSLSLGCNGYVVKPCTKEALYGELTRAGIEVHWE